MTDRLDVVIDYLDAAGDGVAHVGSRTITVPFTIPGERVRVLLRNRSDRAAAQTPAVLLEVLRPSPHRVVPLCPHFGAQVDRRSAPVVPSSPGSVAPARDERGCGGCSWQHIAYPEQLRLKSAIVDRLLREAIRSVPSTRRTVSSVAVEHPWGYRHKVHFVFGNKDDGRRRTRLVMGHYTRSSRRIIAVRECPVHDERGNRAAFRFFRTFARAGVSAATASHASAQAGDAAGVLRSIVLRVATSAPELMATLVIADDGDRRLRAATRLAMEHRDAPSALHLNIHPRGDAFIFGRQTRRISGPERLRQDVAGTSFLISPTAFFQTNVPAAELLVNLVLDAVLPDGTVVDLYAGGGLFALPLARRGQTVVAIEENRTAVADAEASARLNRISPDRCRFIARPVESALAAIRSADTVVMDPPRAGCAPEVIRDVFGRIRPRRVVYISCNPEALARDLHEAAAYRYSIDKVQPVDMFPHTAHIETVVTLTLRG